MGFNPAVLVRAPEVNPVNRKAHSVPMLNPINVYGRVFFFSWFGFMIAFWSWYAFPPLLSDVIAKDLHLSSIEVSNSNIIALVATLLVRLIAGPACDRFGPRYTFAGCLLIGAIPTFLAGTAYTAGELYALRFFIGILGGAFVPCQVWTTGFFDKNIVGTANSLTAGFGNAGGGITYFVMPAVYKSLMANGLSSHNAWRVAFVVPGILIVSVAIALVLCCPDTPTGRWADRMQAAESNLRQHGIEGAVVDVPGSVTEDPKRGEISEAGANSPSVSDEEKKLDNTRGTFDNNEVQLGEQQMLDTARGEIVQKPSFARIAKVIFTPQAFVTAACYFCTFGAELSINSILGTYYKSHLKLGLQEAGDWAAMFGLMNVVCRPLGGVVSDFMYRNAGGVWGKKIILHTYSCLTGVMLIAAGVSNSKELHTLTLLIGVGVAFFLEGANGMNYSLVPHVHPHANGVVSGFTGAMGNFGGVIFAIIFRYNKTHYGKSLWIIGIITIGVNLAVSWIKPIPKGQIGGR